MRILVLNIIFSVAYLIIFILNKLRNKLHKIKKHLNKTNVFFVAHQARARLRERHKENLRKKLELLKAEQGVIEEDDQDSSKRYEQDSSNDDDSDDDR